MKRPGSIHIVVISVLVAAAPGAGAGAARAGARSSVESYQGEQAPSTRMREHRAGSIYISEGCGASLESLDCDAARALARIASLARHPIHPGSGQPGARECRELGGTARITSSEAGHRLALCVFADRSAASLGTLLYFSGRDAADAKPPQP